MAGSFFAKAAQYLGPMAMSLYDTGLGMWSNASAMERQYEYQRALNEHSYSLTQRGYRESPTNQRLGLEAAGYNPLLAVNNGMSFGSYSGGSASMGNPQTGSMTNSYQVMNQMKLNAKQTESTIAKTNAETAYIGEQERTERERQNVMRLEQDILRIDNALKQKDLDTYDRKFLMFLKKSYSEVLLNNATATANQLNAESNFKNSQTNAFNALVGEKRFKWEQDPRNPQNRNATTSLLGLGGAVLGTAAGFAIPQVKAFKVMKNLKNSSNFFRR